MLSLPRWYFRAFLSNLCEHHNNLFSVYSSYFPYEDCCGRVESLFRLKSKNLTVIEKFLVYFHFFGKHNLFENLFLWRSSILFRCSTNRAIRKSKCFIFGGLLTFMEQLFGNLFSTRWWLHMSWGIHENLFLRKS